MAEAEEPRPWVGQDSRTGHERHGTGHEPEHGRAAPEGPRRRPGSDGERLLQRRLGTTDRAARFYDEQVLDHLNERMREFVQRQEMFFLATADASGECDSTFRAGPPGFLQVLGERTLAYPEYRGNGVNASLGNIHENPHLGIMLIDFTRARIGLHINGRATIVEDAEIRASYPDLPDDPVPGRRPQVWVHIEVEEAYIHCAKHIPQMQKAPKRTARDWGTDDYKRKGGDFFGTARDARERAAAAVGGAREHGSSPETGAAVPAEPVAQAEPVASAETAASAEPAVSAEPFGPAATGMEEHALEIPPPGPPAPDFTGSGLTGSGLSASDPSGGDLSVSGLSAPDLSGADVSGAVSSEAGAVSDEAYSEAGDGGSLRFPTVPEQRRSPDVWHELPSRPSFPTASFDSQEDQGGSSSRLGGTYRPGGTGQQGLTAMDGASGALAARAGQSSPGSYMSGSDPDAWRQEAERALAEAQRRGAVSETSSFQGWFG